MKKQKIVSIGVIYILFIKILFAQNTNTKIYFTTQMEIMDYTYTTDTSSHGFGDYWDPVWRDRHEFAQVSEYDIVSKSLTYHNVDSTIMTYIEEDLSCFDPTTNKLYFVSSQYQEGSDSLILGVFDVSTSTFSYDAVLESSSWFDYSTPGIVGDTIEHTTFELNTMECWNDKIYFTTQMEIMDYAYITDTSSHGGFGDYWDPVWRDRHEFAQVSEYDIASKSLAYHNIDSTIITYIEEDISCFDPTTNKLYFVSSTQDELDSLILGVFDVSTSTFSYDAVLESSSWFDYSTPGIVGDTIEHTTFELNTMEVYFKIPSDSLINITECNMLSWNGILYDSSGTYIHTTTNTIGLDSTITLNLTINNSSSSNQIHTSCDGYDWNGQAYTESGTYTWTGTNSVGCDSVATLELTINSISTSIDQSGDSLYAIVNPMESSNSVNWYNIQLIDSVQRIWLMRKNSPTFSPTFDCFYFIVAENSEGCIDTSEIYYYGASASRIESLQSYPNPTQGKTRLEFINENNQYVLLQLLSNNGEVLDNFLTKKNYLDIDLSQYPSGTYYINFDSRNSSQGCDGKETQQISKKIILNK